MERIVYNKTLDTHKSGVQFTLQGFETADKMARQIVISLMANGDALDLPLGQMEAVMYVTTPSGAEPSINACIIKGNTIIYDVLPITEEGITKMQLKLIEASPDGTPTVLATPRFAVEVIKSETDDEGIKDSPTYTAVEKAVAMAKGAYDTRLERIALNSDCMFYAYYADGTVYESDVLKELFLKGDALISESYAVGGTGVRDGEDTDNSKYYSQVAKSMSLETKASGEDALAILDEVKKHGVYTVFSANFETGELVYESPKYDFEIDKESGELNIIGKAYDIEANMVYVIEEWLKGFGVTFPEFKASVDKNAEDIQMLKENMPPDADKINAIIKKYNESTMACVRDADGKVITKQEKIYLTSKTERYRMTDILQSETTVTDTIESECHLELDGLQPEMIIYICYAWWEDTSTHDESQRNVVCKLYDADTDTLICQGEGSIIDKRYDDEPSNPPSDNSTTMASATLSQESMLYIVANKPKIKLVIESSRIGIYSGMDIYGIHLKTDKAERQCYDLIEQGV